MRSTAAWAAGALLALGLGDATAVAQPETRNLKIGTARDPQLATEIAVAKYKGYFEQEGLNVEIGYFVSGAEMMSAVAAKQLMLASFGESPAINLRAGGHPVKIVARMADISGTQQIVAQKGIAKPQDLRGKKVGLQVGSTSEALLGEFLKAHGMKLAEVELVNMSPPDQVAAFARGDVQAICVWQPFVLRAKQRGGQALAAANRSFIAGEEGPKKYYGAHAVLVGREEFLKDNPRTVEAALRAMVKAAEFARGNPDETAKLLGQDIQLPVDDIKAMVLENRYDMSVTSEMIADISRTIEFLAGLGKLKTKPSVAEFVDPSFLSRVAPGLVTWKP
jgi:NitT/TauT family transport system substrate-binding protein